MAPWTLDDIPWDRFDPAKVDAQLLKVAKAASLVERNARDYAAYLVSVFKDDPEIAGLAEQWASEEVQHGMALGMWARRADPGFDFDGAFARFAAQIKLPVTATESVRGSRMGEWLSRCVVESGTSSMYTAFGQAAEEPVLKFICLKIAADEFRHYKLFYDLMKRYRTRDPIGFWPRLAIAAKRAYETEDDELAFAYYAANHSGDGPYDREIYNRKYVMHAYRFYRYGHMERGIAMIFKAVGLKPHGWLNRNAARAALRFMQWRVRRCEAAEARPAAA